MENILIEFVYKIPMLLVTIFTLEFIKPKYRSHRPASIGARSGHRNSTSKRPREREDPTGRRRGRRNRESVLAAQVGVPGTPPYVGAHAGMADALQSGVVPPSL